MITICFVLSAVNPKTGDFENKAVLNSKQKIVEFVREYKGRAICAEGFRINKIGEGLERLNEEENNYVLEICEMIERVKHES